jgi:predicted ATPase
MSINSISLKNFKSIREVTGISFGAINVLIGANGSGKSNLISFFKLLNKIMNRDLQIYISTGGGANRYLYFGQKKSDFLEGEIVLHNEEESFSSKVKYSFKLLLSQHGGFSFEEDKVSYVIENNDWLEVEKNSPFKGYFESNIPDNINSRNAYVINFLENIRTFHFNDTTSTALLKGFSDVNDDRYLKEDAKNLAAFLYKLRKTHPKHYNIIEKTIQSVAPFFNRFDLKPTPGSPPVINLKWLEKGSDDYFDAHYLSDGTLRFICLTTLLLQPDPPATIIIDEPELGLHPSAIDKLAAMIQSASVKTQIIVSTQSIELLNNFSADDVIVVEKKDNQSVFKRLDAESLKDWLEDYTLGELWYKNVIGGKPQ